MFFNLKITKLSRNFFNTKLCSKNVLKKFVVLKISGSKIMDWKRNILFEAAEVSLDPSDADFVSVLHSDAVRFNENGIGTGLGISYPIGHIDFWPNNGFNHPGCEEGLLGQIDDNGGLWEGSE